MSASEAGVPDIEVSYEVVALCPVCPDGIGDIDMVDADTLNCSECDTSWDAHGNNGERA